MIGRLSSVALVLAASGCQSAEEKLVDEHRDRLVAQLDALKALKAAVEEQPHLETANWPAPGVQVGEGGNAQVIFASKLGHACGPMTPKLTDDPAASDYLMLMYADRSEYWFEKVVCGIEGNKELMLGLSPASVETLLAMKYALVVRPTLKSIPQIARDEAKASVDAYLATGEGKPIEHFEPGRLAGDALLYELGTAKLVGNFPFDVTSSDTVEVRGADYGNLVHDLNKKLDETIVEKTKPK